MVIDVPPFSPPLSGFNRVISGMLYVKLFGNELELPFAFVTVISTMLSVQGAIHGGVSMVTSVVPTTSPESKVVPPISTVIHSSNPPGAPTVGVILTGK